MIEIEGNIINPAAIAAVTGFRINTSGYSSVTAGFNIMLTGGQKITIARRLPADSSSSQDEGGRDIVDDLTPVRDSVIAAMKKAAAETTA